MDSTTQLPKTKHPCAGRSKAQRETFEAIAIGLRPPYRRQAFKALLDAGLIVHVEDEVVGRDAFGLVKLPVYEVPLPVHLAWCRWCAQNVSEEDLLGADM